MLAQAPTLLQPSAHSPQLLNHQLAYNVAPPTHTSNQSGTTHTVPNNQTQPTQLSTPPQQVQVNQPVSNGQYILPFLQNINEDVRLIIYLIINFFNKLCKIVYLIGPSVT